MRDELLEDLISIDAEVLKMRQEARSLRLYYEARMLSQTHSMLSRAIAHMNIVDRQAAGEQLHLVPRSTGRRHDQA